MRCPGTWPGCWPTSRPRFPTGCVFAIDSDAHAPGQLDWLVNGTVRAERAGITADRVINTRGADEMAGGRSAEA